MDTDIEKQEPEVLEEVTEMTEAAKANMAANDFSGAVYALVQEYQAKMPLVFMMKILRQVDVDLQAALLGTNIEFVTNALREEFKPVEPPGQSVLVG